MLVDANLLIYAHNRDAAQHEVARRWLTGVLNGPTRVGLPWQSLTAFLRITTNPRAFPEPLTASAAWEQVTAWLAAPRAWIPLATDQHARVLGALIERHRVTGPLVADAELAALAIEHGVPLFSTDEDFARFPEIDWQDPIRGTTIDEKLPTTRSARREAAEAILEAAPMDVDDPDDLGKELDELRGRRGR